MTAHKLLYYAKRLASGKFVYNPKPRLEYNVKLIIVDEISMLPVKLWELLLSHKVYVIAAGDPAQLPPIDPKTDNHVLDNPHIFLDEIMRQAQESEIIRLTMDIRAGKYLKEYKGKEIQVNAQQDFMEGMYHWANQILVATNKKRYEVNNFMRSALGRMGPEPEVGDKLLCRRNAWDIIDTEGNMALVNGTIGYITKVNKETLFYPNNIPSVPIYRVDLETEEGERFQDLPIDANSILNYKVTLTPQQEFTLNKFSKNNPEIELPLEFNYGYAITTHASQGSEWDKVLVLEETFPFEKDIHQRWLYTACTRPREKLVVIKK